MKVAVSIPTYNRLPHLIKAVGAAQKIVSFEEISLSLAISNIASEDATAQYLSQLIDNSESNRIAVSVFNEPRQEINCNWYYLDKVISDDVDWVWMHGDDDHILDPYCLRTLAPFLRDSSLSFIVVPQAKRVGSGHCFPAASSMHDLASQHGIHDLLGWVSQIIVRRDIYRKYAEHHFKLTKYVNLREDFISHRYSSFPHVNYFYENYHNNKISLILKKIIDEQVSPENINLHNENPKYDRAFREGVFFFCEKIANFLSSQGLAVPATFFRYVNKNLVLLMINMACYRRTSGGVVRVAMSEEELNVIKKVIACINDPAFVESVSHLLRCLKNSQGDELETGLASSLNAPVYPFEINRC